MLSGSWLDIGVEALLWLRSSLKLMEKVSQSSSQLNSREDLYSWILSCTSWNRMITPHQTLKVDTVLGQDNVPDLSHTHFTALTIKNAIVDQFRQGSADGLRPSVDLEDPDLPLLLYLHRGRGVLYRVWSGERSMHKRGYRPNVVHKASLRENTAAAL